MQPGQLISPGNDQLGNTPTPNEAEPEPASTSSPLPDPQRTTPRDTTNVEVKPHDNSISWTASEFIEHQKPRGWYVLVVFCGLAISAGLYFILHDMITTVVVAIAALLFGVGGARKPNSRNYSLSPDGLHIGEKIYPYSTFKAFSVIEEGVIDSIEFVPLKRLMPSISIYFPPEQEEQIVSLLADYLPHEDRDHDPIDRLMKRMHF